MNVGLIDEADVLRCAVVSGEDLHVVLLDAPGFGNHGIVVTGGHIDDVVPEEGAASSSVGEVVVVEGLQLDTPGLLRGLPHRGCPRTRRPGHTAV